MLLTVKGKNISKSYEEYSAVSGYFTTFYSKMVLMKVVLLNSFRKSEIKEHKQR